MPKDETLVFENRSEGIPRLVVFKRDLLRPSTGLVVWRVLAIPQDGVCVLRVPRQLQLHARTDTLESGTVYQTRRLTLPSPAARLRVIPVDTDDRVTWVPDLRLAAGEGTREGSIHVSNTHTTAVWIHLLLGGTELLASRHVAVNETVVLDVPPSYHVAWLGRELRPGDPLSPAELPGRTVELCPGQRLCVTGSRMRGYSLSLV